MQQDDYIIERLGVAHYSEAQKANLVEQVRTLIGEAVSEQLSEQQLNEYEAIINDNQTVINAWLEQNVPEYKNSTVYQELASAYESDPERNSPEKIFANLAWIEINVPNTKEITDKVLDEYKAQHLATA